MCFFSIADESEIMARTSQDFNMEKKLLKLKLLLLIFSRLWGETAKNMDLEDHQKSQAIVGVGNERYRLLKSDRSLVCTLVRRIHLSSLGRGSMKMHDW